MRLARAGVRAASTTARATRAERRLHATAPRVKGLTAPGLSSGLAAFGRPLGGSMAVGSGVVIALPVVLVLVIAYAIYKVSKRSSGT